MAKADLKLDSATNDIVVENGDLALIYDNDEIRQRIRTRLTDVRGNWFRDLSYGTDWFGSILGKRSDLTRKAEIERVVRTTEGVAQVLKVDFQTTGRSLDVDLEVLLDDGATIAVRFEELI